ncbi:glycoside hydrolase [Christiangramia fulva]|uniref:chitinase n=1 Tax=Christiangramia fulva TaxID=2126553 RepID=A0A2R3Z3H0_9FLAO|nr:glycoside hydrolase family 18 protein [Christiangramia fulva]AVR44817.1 glycoside hydrolase [Christiangramia fulva]
MKYPIFFLKKLSLTIWLICLSPILNPINIHGNSKFPIEGNLGNNDFKIIAYATPSTNEISSETAKQMNQIIYSFLHLKGNKLEASEKDKEYLSYLNSLKEVNPNLKVLVSLGGWGGCETCSDVFSSEKGREEFVSSVKEFLQKNNYNGIDLDWEYPVIEGFPGHAFKPADKENFTALVSELRKALGPDYVISFAAGGFKDYLAKSINWEEVMPLVDHVNIMSYDIVNGNSTKTGHHTSLFSTENQPISTDYSVRYLDSIGVPREKMVIGAAFYARVWENVKKTLNGRYQPGKFKQGVAYRQLKDFFEKNPGFKIYWDSVAHAPYAYNEEKGFFATFDDSLSVAQKTAYAIKNDLGGIMFWELSNDKAEDGLLDVIYRVKENMETN